MKLSTGNAVVVLFALVALAVIVRVVVAVNRDAAETAAIGLRCNERGGVYEYVPPLRRSVCLRLPLDTISLEP